MNLDTGSTKRPAWEDGSFGNIPEDFTINLQRSILSPIDPCIFKLGRVGFEPTTPAMSRRYLNQAGPPALSCVFSMPGLNISSKKSLGYHSEVAEIMYVLTV
jgi:hypothetical protein